MEEGSLIQYYVEGECEKRLIEVLKTEMQLVYPGKVSVFNVTQKIIPCAMLMNLKPRTTVVLIFDTDVINSKILACNIEQLKKAKNVKEVLMIPQVMNLEDELVRSCNIRKITELLDTTSVREFKAEFIRITNLSSKLIAKGFDINMLWIGKATDDVKCIENDSGIVKRIVE